MTKIIRRRIIPRGVLPPTITATDDLLPPAQVFRGEEPEETPEDLPLPTVDPVEVLDTDTIELYPPVIKIMKPSKVDIVTEEDEDEEEEELPATEQEPVEREPVRVDKRFRARKAGKNPIEDIMLAMREGEAVVIKREGTTTYAVSLVPSDILISKTGVKYKKGFVGGQYWDEVLNPAFSKWLRGWNAMTYAEKLEYAEKHKLVWRKSDILKLNLMTLTEAARTEAGVEKYKPEYQNRKDRSRIRG